jgi:hypothetical protein
MANRLAKLSDLKVLLGTTESGSDALLLQLLQEATHAAEYHAGRLLRRVADITEYPWDEPAQCRFVRLVHAPIEAVTSVKQLYSPASTAAFAAETALVLNEDWMIADPDSTDASLPMSARGDNRGGLERINSVWYLRGRCLQVIYSGGFVDPGDPALWVTGTSYAADALVRYPLMTDEAYVCISAHTAGSSNRPGTSGGAAYWRSVIDPPEDLQRGVLQEAWRLWRRRSSGGGDRASVGGASIDHGADETSPALVRAAMRMKNVI